MADYVVGRPFTVDGRAYPPGARVPGEVVAGWRNRDRMVRQRWLRRIDGPADATARLAVVLRAFSHEGQTLAVGTLVALDGWRNADLLIASRFLREAHEGDLEAASAPPLVLTDVGDLEPAGASGPVKGKKARRDHARAD